MESWPDMMIVRYEDFALNPILLAKKVYEYLDIDFPETVKKELLEITRGASSKKKYTSDKTYRYGTTRNSKKVVFKWRNKLDWETVRILQEGCRDTLDEFGYRLFTKNEFK